MHGGHRLGVFALSGLALAVACNGETTAGGPGGGGPHSAAVSGYGATVAHALCDAIFNCTVPNDDLLGLAIGFGTQARCEQVYLRAIAGSTHVSPSFDDLARLESAGVIHEDAGALSRCKDLIAQGCYTGSFGASVDCREVFEGTMPAGQPCHRSEECAGDSYCDEGSAATCPGVCTPRKPPGSACEDSNECAAGASRLVSCSGPSSASVSPAVDGGTFVNLRKCTLVDAGAPSAGDGQPCALRADTPASRFCAHGLWCDLGKAADGTSLETGVCRRPFPAGAACDDIDDVCVPGSLCYGPTGAKKCGPVAPVQSGGSCAPSADGRPVYCDVFSGVTCDNGSKLCVPLGNGSRGSRCDTTDSGDLLPCQPGLYCNGQTATCGDVQGPGGPCEGDFGCTTARCDYATKTCKDQYCTR